eukprot:9881712-Ditylum_brightwellii.AAC.1
MVQLLESEGHTLGPVNFNKEGDLLPTSEVGKGFHNQLEHIQTTHPTLINGSVDVMEAYRVSRSLRRGSLS